MRSVAVASLVLVLAGCDATIENPPLTFPDGGRPTDAGIPPDLDAPPLDGGSEMDTGGDGGPVETPDAGSDAGSALDDAGPMAEGCITTVSAGHHVFACGPITYDVEVSAPCALGGCGLVLDVHGATMTATSEDLNTNLRALGSAAGYVVVQPTAPGSWWTPATHDAMVFDFLTLAARAFRVDPDRIHFTGFSQGGFMTWRMLCEHADVFASVAPGAACGALFPHCPFTATERPSREIPVLYLHGVNDPIVAGCRTAMRDSVVAGWSMALDTFVSMDADHTWTRYRSPTGNVFEYIEHDYRARSTILSGHCFPGSPDVGTSTFGTSNYGCEDTAAFAWGQAVIEFFVAHPRG